MFLSAESKADDWSHMKKSVSIVLSLATLLLLCGVVAAVLAFAASGTEADLPGTAEIGQSVRLPAYEQDGKTAIIRITYPDGSVYQSNTLRVRSYGAHVIEYLIDGEVVKTHTCMVPLKASDLFSVNRLTTNLGTSEYGTDESGATFGGVLFSTRSGGSVTFERTIDLNDLTKNDTLVRLKVVPSSPDTYDFGQVHLTFTDTEDSSVWLRVTLSADICDGRTAPSPASRISYIRVSANGQVGGGYGETPATREIDFDDRKWYGSVISAGFSDRADKGAVFDIRYDASEKAIYVPMSTQRPTVSPWLVSDLDDPTVHGANVWSGFTSGKVRMTVSFDQFYNRSGQVLFGEIGGLDLSAPEISDTEAPEIHVDFDGMDKAPNSFIGATYKVFDAVASDFIDQQCSLSYRVYYGNNLDGARYDVSVENGVFTTDKVGKYTIEYTASDWVGNTAVRTVEFLCKAEPEPITVEDIPTPADTNVYTPVTLTDPAALRTYGGNGKVTLSRVVIAPDGSEASVSGNILLPVMTGTYTVRYIATDAFGNEETVSVPLTVKAVDTAIFTGTPSLPRVMISDFTYRLPMVGAVICRGGEVLPTTVVRYVNGVEQTSDVVTAPKNVASVLIEYCALNPDGSTYETLSFTVPVRDGNGGKNRTAYFYNADGTIDVTELADMAMLGVASEGDVFFANVLNSSYFSAQLVLPNTGMYFGTLAITLTDSEQEGLSLTFALHFTPAGITVTVGDGESLPFGVKSDAGNTYLNLYYDGTNAVLQDTNDAIVCKIAKDDRGNPFSGFTNGVYVTFSVSDVQAASRIGLSVLNNQSFGYGSRADAPTADKTAPEIVVAGIYEKRAYLGDVLTLLPAEAYDVLGQITSLTVSVYGPDGQVVLSPTAVGSAGTVTLTQVGRYRIFYAAEDTHGQSVRIVSNVLVLDGVAPELRVDADYKQVYRVGTTITLPDAAASDNLENVYCDIYVLLPSGELRLLTHSVNGEVTSYLSTSDGTYPNSFKAGDRSFRLEAAGKYTLYVTAYDDNYNCVTESIVFWAID